MITITYHLPRNQREVELEWLREQKIFPAHRDSWTWSPVAQETVEFACIVSPDQALTLKLRHKLDRQEDYFQK
jgi:hypothetical protein